MTHAIWEGRAVNMISREKSSPLFRKQGLNSLKWKEIGKIPDVAVLEED